MDTFQKQISVNLHSSSSQRGPTIPQKCGLYSDDAWLVYRDSGTDEIDSTDIETKNTGNFEQGLNTANVKRRFIISNVN